MRSRTPAQVIVRSMDRGGETLRASQVHARLRLQGSPLDAALARPDVSRALTDVSWRTGAGHVTGLEVVVDGLAPGPMVHEGQPVYGSREPEVVWRGDDGLLDQALESPAVPEGPVRAAIDWHEIAKHAVDLDDDERRLPEPADKHVVRRNGRIVVRRGAMRPPVDVENIAEMVRLRGEGMSFKRIAKRLKVAAWTVSRYIRAFEEDHGVSFPEVQPVKPARRASSRRLPSATVARIAELAGEGISAYRIARVLGLGETTVKRYIRSFREVTD